MITGSNMMTYQYGARGKRGPLTLFRYDNGLRPPTPLGPPSGRPAAAARRGDRWSPARRREGLSSRVQGGRECRACCRWRCTVRYTRPPKTLPRVAGHHADWLQACKGSTPACSNFEYGARLTEFVLLGTLALRTGKVMKWDAAGMKAINVPQAQPFIEGRYRKGWELPV